MSTTIYKVMPEDLYALLISRITEEEKARFDWFPDNQSKSNTYKCKTSEMTMSIKWIKFEDKFSILPSSKQL